MDSSEFIEIIVGTYEEMIIGYKVLKDGANYKMEQSFTNHSHCGCIKSIATSQQHLASGSSDETVKLFNIRSRLEVGSLVQQVGTINCLEFHDSHFLFSGSDDGSICIWKSGSWQCLKTLLGHKGSVTALAIHPSGKLALSLSKDRTLKTWNLIKGRAAFTTNIKAVGDFIRWSLDGSLYAVVIGNRVDIYNVETAGIIHKIDFGRRINCVSFITNDILAVAGEGENIEIHAARQAGILGILATGANRVKAVNVITSPDEKTHKWLVSSSSDGFIKIWNLDPKNFDSKPNLVAFCSTGCRITCQAISDVTLRTVQESTDDVTLKDDVKQQRDEELEVENIADAVKADMATAKRKKKKRPLNDSQQKPKSKKTKSK